MPNPVVIDFILRGIPDVQRAFRSIEQAAANSERSQTNTKNREARQRQQMVEREARDKVRAMLKADAEVRRAQDRATREVERMAKARLKAEEKAERDGVRAAERAATEKIRIQRQVDREFTAMQRRQEREREKIIRDDERREERAAQNRARIRERSASMAGRHAAREANQAMADKKAFARGIADRLTSGVGAGVSKVAGMAGSVAGMFGQLGGGFSIADSVSHESNLRKQAATLSASTILSRAGQIDPKTGKVDASMGEAVSTNQVLAKAKEIGLAQNIDPGDVMKGFDSVKKLTGNLSIAMKAMPNIAKLATATGGDIGEMSGLAGNILAANPNISADELDKQMRIFTRQGVVGGIEVGDFAKYGSRITAAASAYGVDPSKGITKETNEATLGAMAQMSRQYGSASTPAEAAMGALRFTTDIAKHSKDLEKVGIKVSDGKGGLNNMKDILMQMITMTGGDLTKFGKTGLGERGVKPLEGAAAIYRNAGGGKSGMAAVEAEFAKYTSFATKAEIEEANKRVLAEQQVEQQMLQLKTAVGEQLLPELIKLLPELKKLSPAFVDLLKTGMPAIVDLLRTFAKFAKENEKTIQLLAAHPIPAIIGFEIAKSFASANLAELLRRLFTKALGAGGGGGAGGMGGKLGAVGAGVAAAAMTAAVVKPVVDTALEGQVMGQVKTGEFMSRLKHGSAADQKAARAEIAQMQDQYGGAGGWLKTAGMGVLAAGGGVYSSVTGEKSDSVEEFKKAMAAREIIDSEGIKQAMSQAIREGIREGAASPGPGNPAQTAGIVQRTQ